MISVFKFIFRLAGLGLLAVAIIAGISDASTSIAQSQTQLQPLGQLLFSLFPDTFPILQPAIERHVHPALWDPVLLTLMTWPVWAVFAPLGLAFLWLGARRRGYQPQFA
ncbi:hypothetical protein ABVF61_14965 [Roseibium sp. HPY-6]|uniref:hypothetical protein n=1 Tax=Roseibium sp. HPY-6 TaxID=3229852 RepID=UPI00338FA910